MVRQFALATALLSLMGSCAMPDPSALTAPVAGAVRMLPPLALAGAMPRAATVMPELVVDPSTIAARLARSTVAAPFLVSDLASDDGVRATDCLTAAIYYEARSESTDGQRAVAQVVLNRVRNRAWPSSICGVVYQAAHGVCQFTFACDGSTLHPREAAAWDRARRIAEAALSGNVYAPVGSATFYHTDQVQPWWSRALDQVTQIGAHIFYSLTGQGGTSAAFSQGYRGVEPAGAANAPLMTARAIAPATRMSFDDGAVTVYREGLSAVAATATDAVATAAATAVSPSPVVPKVSGGVRVHYGAAAEDRDSMGVQVHIGLPSN